MSAKCEKLYPGFDGLKCTVELVGCDDVTNFDAWFTPQEYDLLTRLRDMATEAGAGG